MEKIKREEFNVDKMGPEEFEKDHDENGHIDFIHAGANLRARNYKIDECDRNKTKQIAGKIIPTILTTTASIAGITSLQLYTMLQTDNIEYFRECFFNLNSNFFFFSKPSEPIKMQDKEMDPLLMSPTKAIPEGWNCWDKIEIKGPKTIGELIDYLKKTYNVDVDILTVNGVTIIATFLDGAKKKMDVKIEDAYQQISEKKLDKNYLNIQVIGNINNVTIEGKTFEKASAFIPPIKYIF